MCIPILHVYIKFFEVDLHLLFIKTSQNETDYYNNNNLSHFFWKKLLSRHEKSWHIKCIYYLAINKELIC